MDPMKEYRLVPNISTSLNSSSGSDGMDKFIGLVLAGMAAFGYVFYRSHQSKSKPPKRKMIKKKEAIRPKEEQEDSFTPTSKVRRQVSLSHSTDRLSVSVNMKEDMEAERKEFEEPIVRNPLEKGILDLKNKDFIIGEDAYTLMMTKHFNVIVNTENQTLPGMLRIITDPALGDWDAWKKEHWIEFIQVARLCELTLIQTFDARSLQLKPSLDHKLINVYGRQIAKGHETSIEFDIVPRYIHAVQISHDLSERETLTTKFVDRNFSKPFNFKEKPFDPSQRLFDTIVSKLRETLANTDFKEFELHDHFHPNEHCLACKPSFSHPYNTGLAEVAGFRLALDARSQEERGRTFCATTTHVPAFRYWKDEWMVTAGEIFAAYRETVNQVYPPDGSREFDFMCLMNLPSVGEGHHTNLQFIPRTEGGKDYGKPFSMDPASYQPLSGSDTHKEVIVSRFQKALVEKLIQRGISVDWPKFSKQLLSVGVESPDVSPRSEVSASTPVPPLRFTSPQALEPLPPKVVTAEIPAPAQSIVPSSVPLAAATAPVAPTVEVDRQKP